MNAGLVDLFGDDSVSDDEIEQENAVSLRPEVERGNIEYKLKLIDPSPTRLERLVTQMKWRLQEGLGEAIYQIGVEDNGFLSGLNEYELKQSLNTLETMASRLGASTTVIREREIEDIKSPLKCKKSAEVLIRKVPDDSQFIDIKIAIIGNVESGKSTIVSVLTHGELDNGYGRARLNLFRHPHEIQTGMTSSINNEIMGFDDFGHVQNISNCRTSEEICEKSSKMITFIDLAGHQKYMKTTVFGLTGYAPDFNMLLINATNGIVGTTKEHLGFSMALDVPVFVVINKIDSCTPEAIKQTISTIEFLLKSPGCCKIPYLIESEDDAILSAQKTIDPKICPIFTISCVDGTNLNLLKKFLNVLPPIVNKKEEELKMTQDTEFRVDEVYFKKKPGHIIAGNLIKGTIKEHERLLLGPFEMGDFIPVDIQTAQRYRVPCRFVRAGQSAALSIGNPVNITQKIRKGMVLVSEKLDPKACKEFEAKIDLLYHVNQISKGFQATVHIGNVCQTASITYMDKGSIKNNEKAKVVWRFKSRVEYLTVGTKLIFREGTTKGMGEVTRIIPFSIDDSSDDSKKNENMYKTKKQKLHSPETKEMKRFRKRSQALSESNAINN